MPKQMTALEIHDLTLASPLKPQTKYGICSCSVASNIWSFQLFQHTPYRLNSSKLTIPPPPASRQLPFYCHQCRNTTSCVIPQITEPHVHFQCMCQMHYKLIENFSVSQNKCFSLFIKYILQFKKLWQTILVGRTKKIIMEWVGSG